ncbi:peptidase C39 family protein [Sporolactobacillus sp. THM7-7]|nr:peptidase C39 family protein [Sporolactobacillus sp. THM7-7]
MHFLKKHWLPVFLIFDLILAAWIISSEYPGKIHASAAFIGDQINRFFLTAKKEVANGAEQIAADRTDEDGKARINAPHIRQEPELPRGCEVTSLAMLLQSAGIQANKLELAHHVEKVPYRKNGLYGNPHQGFVGDMERSHRPGYGVYHEPLAALAEKYMPGQIVDLSGKPFDVVLDQLQNGVPVLVITNVSFKPLSPQSFRTWETASGKVKITFFEHAVLVTGFDEQRIYFNDPLGKKNASADRSAFIRAWKQMGSQAISYRKLPVY